MDEPATQVSDGAFGGLLEDEKRPNRVIASMLPDRVRIRLPSAAPHSPRVVPITVGAGIGAFALGTALCMASPVKSSVFWAAFVSLALMPLIGLGIGLVSQILVSEEQNRIARQVEISSHRILFRSIHDRVVGEWGLHDIEDLWASRDWLSSSVAVQHSGAVEAVRMPTPEVARWVLALMRNWRDERLQEPDEAELEAVHTLRTGAKRQAAR